MVSSKPQEMQASPVASTTPAKRRVDQPFVPEQTSGLASYPPPEQWDDWVEFEPRAWPEKREHHYMLVPTTCFNCESACGLMAYVDRETLQVRKLEGNPFHPGSRGRNCAKGPATLTQINDPDRILYPMKRSGPRGGGQWERVSWDDALDAIAGQIRAALTEGRPNEVMYHVGRPGEDGYMERVLQSWGIDGHNSHTNICSSGGRTGYAFWMGIDRPSPDYANAKFILLVSAHLESGHYFNPHAQRIIEAKSKGAKIAVIDPRLSNTASMSDYWLPASPGTEAALLLGMANVLIQEDLFDREFVRRWTNWEDYLRTLRPELEVSFDAFVAELKREYAKYTPEFVEQECGVPASMIVEIAHEIARAGSALSTHTWRAASAGHLGGWAVPRTLFFLNVLTGSIGTEGGTAPNVWDKFVPRPFAEPTKQKVWNEVSWPREYPLAHHEMSFLLPHFLKKDAASWRCTSPASITPSGRTQTASSGWMPCGMNRRWGCTLRYPHLERERLVRQLCPPDGCGCRAARYHSMRRTPPSGWDSASQWCASPWSGWARRSISPIKPIPVKSGKRTNSGSSCPGASTRTARSAFANTTSRPIGRARRSRSTSITSGSSRTRFRDCPRRPRPRA